MPATKFHEGQDELGLLSAVLDGDRDAAGAFFTRYNDVVEMAVRVVYRRCGLIPPEQDIKDVVGDVWLQLLDRNKRCLRRFEPAREVQLTTWISVLARNRTIDRLRLRYDRRVTAVNALQLEAHAGSVPPATEQIEDRERQHVAAAALRQLGADDQRFLQAWYVEGRPPQELANEFGIAVGTVYSRRFKIQSKLARLVHRLLQPRRLPAPTVH